MFGWEFPPHISGGLGTACFGLTRFLAAEKTKILLVIPKATGDEAASNLTIINASAVPVQVKNHGKSNRPQYWTHAASENILAEEKVINILPVPALLTPYTALGPFREIVKTSTKKKRRHSFNPPILPAKNESRPLFYSFSGSYGPNLYEEVMRYAEVAGQIAKHYTFNVIHAHDWLTYPAGVAAKKVSQKPLVVHVHATEYDRTEKPDPRILAIERHGMEQADRVIAVSHWTKNILITRYGIPETKITVIHNGVIRKKKLGRAESPFGKKVVTFLGRITHQKGPEYFIEAAAKVHNVFPEVHFVMAGSGDLLEKMILHAARLKISSHFHFTGFLNGPAVDRIWSMSAVYVMPSVSEPFGITPLEAVRAGVPVIISRQSGVSEVLPHAIKVDFWNVDELANAICTVLKYKSLSETLRKNAKQAVRQITWRKAAKKVNRIYHELYK